MTAHALTDDDAVSQIPDVWDAERLASLITDVGESGLRDILRLFLADMPFLHAQLATAIAAGDETAARAALSQVLDSAEALGLSALACVVRSQREAPLAQGHPDQLALEIARIRYVPSLKHAS
jgi:HPt (histidine-containing phosphotransfer) domain-containing protein